MSNIEKIINDAWEKKIKLIKIQIKKLKMLLIKLLKTWIVEN